MLGIYQNHAMKDSHRRSLIFKGELVTNSANNATLQLCNHAKEMINNAFAGCEPEIAQQRYLLEEYVSIIGRLKSDFTNNNITKKLVQGLLTDLDLDLEKTYFDVPRLRIVTFDNYLSSGVGYAYKPHRDIWYSSPTAQINYWMPIYDICAENAMAIFPEYWHKAIENSSNEFDYEEWKKVGRKMAATFVENDTRKHPLPLQADPTNGICIAGCAGDLLMFSAAQLHATIPNQSTKTRFSLDFRTINVDDLLNNCGAPNVDSAAKGTTLSDFIRASDLSALPEKYINQYLSKAVELTPV